MIMSMRKATMLLGSCLMCLSLAGHAGDMMMKKDTMMDKKM